MTAEALDVAIIGAGTAGLSARAEVAKLTDSYRVFDPGPYGTTCARTACMPSKALLQSAHDFHRRHAFEALGILGGDGLRVDAARVFAATRALRDDLVAGVVEGMADWREGHLVPHRASFGADGVLQAGGRAYRPRATVIATGSRPVVPPEWRDRFGDRILTSDDIFGLDDLPRRMAVIGLGAVGLELGQALARLGVAVTGFDPSPALGGLSDPGLQERLRAALSRDMTIVEARAEPAEGRDGAITMRWDGGEAEVDCLLVALGRAPNLDGLGLDRIGIGQRDDGGPALPEGRLNAPGTRVYFAGDAGPGPALLHEASDTGRVAGHFAARGGDACLDRRVPLRIVFCDPQIALAGATWDDLAPLGGDAVVVGTASFDRAGRNRLQRGPGGALHVHAERATGRLLGVAILGPGAEHMAHLAALAIGRGDDLGALLRMPAYHPTHEEVLRRALRAAQSECDGSAGGLVSIRCQDAAVDAGSTGG